MRFIASLIISLFAILIPRDSRACSICGCDPADATLGFDRPSQRDLRVAIEDRYLQKESGSADDGSRESEREDRIALRLQYAPPLPRLSFQLELPFYAWKQHQGPTNVVDDTNRGFGDLIASARYEVVRLGGITPRHVISLVGSLKAPTGNNSHLAPVDDGTIDEHKQIGTGTWDELIGAWYTYGDYPTIAYAGVTARINGTNSRGNHYGNALFGTLGVRRSFLENRRLIFALDAQGRNAGKDTIPGNTYDPNSGGLIAYAVGTAGYALTNKLLVRATVQVPVYTALNGVQGEHPVGFVALAYDLPL